jgi:hypothetical protein
VPRAPRQRARRSTSSRPPTRLAAVLRYQAGTTQAPFERAEAEDALGTAKEHLGETTFATRWLAGQELSVEEAIETAAVLGT